MPVRLLEPVLVDRIAAGEVVERPAAAVKELVENALDAGATAIEVTVEEGGRSLIRVVDDGHGMGAEDLALCVERHATSKLPDGDLMAIGTLGFRGEALPSIGSVSRLRIVTRAEGAPNALEIVVDCGAKGPIRPVAGQRGTRVEVQGLFQATPARLKFLRTDKAEAAEVSATLKRIAMAYPGVRFTLRGDGPGFDLPAEPEGEGRTMRRLARVIDPDFARNSIKVEASRDDVALDGYVSIPSFNRGNASHVYFSVNGRPVRDKLLLGAVRGAYHDTLASDRHPYVVLALTCELGQVDVNCSPAKTDVRFRNPEAVKSLVVSGIRAALREADRLASTTNADRALAALGATPRPWGGDGSRPAWPPQRGESRPSWPPASPAARARVPEAGLLDGFSAPSADARASEAPSEPDLEAHPLGAARAQIHECFIVAQTRDGMVLVDQHAAHERLVYERLKAERRENGVRRQGLLIPEVVELAAPEAAAVADAAPELERLGLVVEAFGPGAVLVRETPAMLGKADPKRLVRDVADALVEGGRDALEARVDAVLSSMACHGSIRSGRRMRPEEMNALLREMEANPMSGTCNHGRPTVLKLDIGAIHRLFGR